MGLCFWPWNFQGLKGSNTILWNIQGLSFVLSGISRGKVKNEKSQRWGEGGRRGSSKKYILNRPCLDFLWNSPMTLI